MATERKEDTATTTLRTNNRRTLSTIVKRIFEKNMREKRKGKERKEARRKLAGKVEGSPAECGSKKRIESGSLRELGW